MPLWTQGFPCGPVVKALRSHCESTGLIPGCRIKVSHAMRRGQNAGNRIASLFVPQSVLGTCHQTLSPRPFHITIPGPRSWRPPWSLSQGCGTGQTPSGWLPLTRSSKGNQGRKELELVDVMETPQHLPKVAHKPQTLYEGEHKSQQMEETNIAQC